MPAMLESPAGRPGEDKSREISNGIRRSLNKIHDDFRETESINNLGVLAMILTTCLYCVIDASCSVNHRRPVLSRKLGMNQKAAVLRTWRTLRSTIIVL